MYTVRFASLSSWQVDVLRGAMSASAGKKLKSSWEEDAGWSGGEEWSRAGFVIDISEEDLNDLLRAAFTAAEVITGELPWESSVEPYIPK